MSLRKSSRKWRIARWALLVAGAVGVASPAPAQLGKFLTGRPAASQPVRMTPISSPQLSEAQSMLEQVRVELAWLSDPATFPWPLTAHATGGVLQVSGEAPNQAVRQQALRIAGANSSLSVVDGIKINESLVRPVGVGGDEPLAKTAPAHLQKYMGEQSSNVQVSVRGNGQVVVTGTIGSHEEKLAVSQCLRAVNGCTSVVNQLRVNTVMQEGRPHSVVSIDGRLVVSDPSGSVANPVRSAGYTPSQEVPTVQPIGGTANPTTPTPERRPVSTPFRIFNRTKTETPTETPKPPTSTLPPSMQSGAYQHLTGKTPAPTPSNITRVSATLPVQESGGDLGRLQQRIRQVGGAGVQDVQVTPSGPKKLDVKVKIHRADEAESLAGKILSMPELMPYEVSMSMTTAGK